MLETPPWAIIGPDCPMTLLYSYGEEEAAGDTPVAQEGEQVPQKAHCRSFLERHMPLLWGVAGCPGHQMPAQAPQWKGVAG